MLRLASRAIGLLLGSTNASQAVMNCITQGQVFRFEQNDKVTYQSIMNGKGCRYVFGVFQKAVIMKPPANGTLSQIGEFTFLYAPKQGFVGKDDYVLYICGTNRRGSGCSRLTYEATIR